MGRKEYVQNISYGEIFFKKIVKTSKGSSLCGYKGLGGANGSIILWDIPSFETKPEALLICFFPDPRLGILKPQTLAFTSLTHLSPVKVPVTDFPWMLYKWNYWCISGSFHIDSLEGYPTATLKNSISPEKPDPSLPNFLVSVKVIYLEDGMMRTGGSICRSSSGQGHKKQQLQKYSWFSG